MTPGYAIKHWWRAARLPGESLKAFARRYAWERPGRAGTATQWLQRKGCRASAATWNDVQVTVGGIPVGPPGPLPQGWGKIFSAENAG